VVGREAFVLKMNAVQVNAADLVVTDGEPCPAAAHQVPVHARGIHKRHERGVGHAADPAPSQVVDLEADQLGEVK